MKPLALLWRLGLSVAVAVVLFILLSNTLTNPVAINTRTYTAQFTDASGLHPDGDVRVRGVSCRKGRIRRPSRVTTDRMSRRSTSPSTSNTASSPYRGSPSSSKP